MVSGLDADAARWLDGRYSLAIEDVRPVGPFLRTLPKEAARSLELWDRRARAGALPVLEGLEDDQYGEDLQTEGIEVVDDGKDISAIREVESRATSRASVKRSCRNSSRPYSRTISGRIGCAAHAFLHVRRHRSTCPRAPAAIAAVKPDCQCCGCASK
jgi:hypothetical protein